MNMEMCNFQPQPPSLVAQERFPVSPPPSLPPHTSPWDSDQLNNVIYVRGLIIAR